MSGSIAGAEAARPARPPARRPARVAADALPAWLPLAALTLLAAALRLSTLDLQSFWYDEAFTPVHVLHASLFSTLRSVSHTENTPPLWYVIAWADARVLGTGALALRLPSALAGIATVPLAWAIGQRLAGRRAALITAAIVAVNPLFVWYSQEARAYALFVLTASLTLLCFLRARAQPSGRRMAAFAAAGVLALLSHYFAVFVLLGMAALLLYGRRTRRAALPALAALALVGLALLPLINAQGGHGTQWIGEWALSSRLQAILQYYLTGYSGAPLGHGIELLVALPIVAGLGLGAWRLIGDLGARGRAGAPGAPGSGGDARGAGGDACGSGGDARGGRGPGPATIALLIAAAGILIPIALALLGADYLAPRNLVAAMVPVSALVGVMFAAAVGARGAGGGAVPLSSDLALGLAAIMCLAFLAVSIDVDLSPRLQRGNWRDVARALRPAGRDRVITTVELGSAPLQYYLAPLHNLPRGATVRTGEIDETGYAPLRSTAGLPPAPGFHLAQRLDVDGLIVYRFRSAVPREVSEATLRRDVITSAPPNVLVGPRARVSLASSTAATPTKPPSSL